MQRKSDCFQSSNDPLVTSSVISGYLFYQKEK